MSSRPKPTRHFVIPDTTTDVGGGGSSSAAASPLTAAGGPSATAGSDVWEFNATSGSYGKTRPGTITTSYPTTESVIDDDFRGSKRLLFRSATTGKKATGATNSMFTHAGGAAVNNAGGGYGGNGMNDYDVTSARERTRVSVKATPLAGGSANNAAVAADDDLEEPWVFSGPVDVDFGEARDPPDAAVFRELLAKRAISKNKMATSGGTTTTSPTKRKGGSSGKESSPSAAYAAVPSTSSPQIVCGPSAVDMMNTTACALCGVIFSKKALKFRTTARRVHEQRNSWADTMKAAEDDALRRARRKGFAISKETPLLGNSADYMTLQDRAAGTNGGGSSVPHYAIPTEKTSAINQLETNTTNSNIIQPASPLSMQQQNTSASSLTSGGGGINNSRGGGRSQSPTKDVSLGALTAAHKLASAHMYGDVSVCVFCAQFFDQYEPNAGDTSVASINAQMIKDTRHLSQNVEARIALTKAEEKVAHEKFLEKKKVFEDTGHFPRSDAELTSIQRQQDGAVAVGAEEDGTYSDVYERDSEASATESEDYETDRTPERSASRNKRSRSASPAVNNKSGAVAITKPPTGSSTTSPTNPAVIVPPKGAGTTSTTTTTPGSPKTPSEGVHQTPSSLVKLVAPSVAADMVVDCGDAQTALNAILGQMVLVHRNPTVAASAQRNNNNQTTSNMSSTSSIGGAGVGGGPANNSATTAKGKEFNHSPTDPAELASKRGFADQKGTKKPHNQNKSSDGDGFETSSHDSDVVPYDDDDPMGGTNRTNKPHHPRSGGDTSAPSHLETTNLGSSPTASPVRALAPDDLSSLASPNRKAKHRRALADNTNENVDDAVPYETRYTRQLKAAAYQPVDPWAEDPRNRHGVGRNPQARKDIIRNKVLAKAVYGMSPRANTSMGDVRTMSAQRMMAVHGLIGGGHIVSPHDVGTRSAYLRMGGGTATTSGLLVRGGSTNAGYHIRIGTPASRYAEAVKRRSASEFSNVRSSGYGTSHYDPSQVDSPSVRGNSRRGWSRSPANGYDDPEMDSHHRQYHYNSDGNSYDDDDTPNSYLSRTTRHTVYSPPPPDHHKTYNVTHRNEYLDTTRRNPNKFLRCNNTENYYTNHNYVPASARRPSSASGGGGGTHHHVGTPISMRRSIQQQHHHGDPAGLNFGDNTDDHHHTPPSKNGRGGYDAAPSSASSHQKRQLAHAREAAQRHTHSPDRNSRANSPHLIRPSSAATTIRSSGGVTSSSDGLHHHHHGGRAISPTSGGLQRHVSTGQLLHTMRVEHDRYNEELIQRRKERLDGEAAAEAERRRLQAEQEARDFEAEEQRKARAAAKAEERRRKMEEEKRRLEEEKRREEEERRLAELAAAAAAAAEAAERAKRRVQIVEPQKVLKLKPPKKREAASPPRQAVDPLPPPPPPATEVDPLLTNTNNVPKPKKFVKKGKRGTVSTDDGGYIVML